MTIDTLWYTRCPVVTAFGIAVRLGLLEQEFRGDGIQVQSLRQSLDKKTRNSHFEHTQPDSFRHGGNIPALFVRSRGADVRLLGVTWANEVQQVLTLPSSGIRTVRDLKGRRLALPRRLNDAIDFWRAALLHGYASALSTEGLSLDDVELVDIPIERSFVDDAAAAPSADGSLWNAAYMRGHAREEILALVRGQADALFAHGSVAVDTRTALGARVVVDIGSHPDRSLRINNLTPLTLTVSGGLLAQAPEVIARWLARIIEAAEWAKAHPADATTRSRPWFESGLDRASDEQGIIRSFGALVTKLHAAQALLARAGRTLDESARNVTTESAARASLAVAEAKAFAGDTAVEIANELFALAGTSATLAKWNLDRHWRNARTHSLHDPSRWKLHHIGNEYLNRVPPPNHGLL